MESVTSCRVNDQAPLQNHRVLCGFTKPVWEALAAVGTRVSFVSAGRGQGAVGAGLPPSTPPPKLGLPRAPP